MTSRYPPLLVISYKVGTKSQYFTLKNTSVVSKTVKFWYFGKFGKFKFEEEDESKHTKIKLIF